LSGTRKARSLVRIGVLGFSVDVAVAMVLLLFMPLGTIPTIVLAAAIVLSGVSMLWLFTRYFPGKVAELGGAGRTDDRKHS